MENDLSRETARKLEKYDTLVCTIKGMYQNEEMLNLHTIQTQRVIKNLLKELINIIDSD